MGARHTPAGPIVGRIADGQVELSSAEEIGPAEVPLHHTPHLAPAVLLQVEGGEPSELGLDLHAHEGGGQVPVGQQEEQDARARAQVQHPLSLANPGEARQKDRIHVEAVAR
jgi:hypothetical protein